MIRGCTPEVAQQCVIVTVGCDSPDATRNSDYYANTSRVASPETPPSSPKREALAETGVSQKALPTLVLGHAPPLDLMATPGSKPRSFAHAAGKTTCEELICSLQQQMLAEFSLMNRKLDNLAGHVGFDKSPTATRLTQPRIMGKNGAPVDTLLVHNADVSAAVEKARAHHQEIVQDESQPLEDRAAKFKRIRKKIRAIGAIIAAGKRRHRESLGNDLTTAPSRIMSGFSSSRQSKLALGSLTQGFAAMFWNSDTGDRGEQIERALHSLRTGKGCRYKLWQFVESPYSSRPALIYSWLLKLILVSSVIVALVDSSCEGACLKTTQIIFEVTFVLEIVLRMLCCPNCFDFMLSASNIVDLISFLPLIFRLVPTSIGSLSGNQHAVLSMVPFLRLLKLMRQFEQLQLLVQAFELAFEALPSLLYLAAVLGLFFAEMLYLVEPSDSDINDLPTAIWFALVTMTTVGYGDYTPETTAGHMVASALIISSMLYMAVPLGIVGNAFSEVWGDRDRLLVTKRFRDAFLEGGFTLQAFQDIFSIFDADGNGSLDIDEFSLMLKCMQMNISEDRVQLLYQALDHQGAGVITLQALVDGLAPKAFGRHFVRGRSLMPSRMIADWSLSMSSKPSESLTQSI